MPRLVGTRHQLSVTLNGSKHVGYYIRHGDDLEVVYAGRTRWTSLGMFQEYPGEIARHAFKRLVAETLGQQGS